MSDQKPSCQIRLLKKHTIAPSAEPINLPLDKPSLLIPRIARRIRAIPIPARVLPINHNLSVVNTTDRSLDDLKTLLTSEASHAWLQRNAPRLENGYYSITTTLLRRLPIEEHLIQNKAVP